MIHKLRLAARLGANLLDNRGRPLPDFVIIGAQKAGTSSLFEYLVQHPNVQGSFIKEVQFFTRRHWLGERGYRAFFGKNPPNGTLCGEATPYYLFSGDAPQRASAMIPQAKLIILLREPVSRAYSHYKHNCRRGDENRPFEDAIAADLKIVRETKGIGRANGEEEHSYRHHSYIRRGLYVEQIERWLKFYPREDIFIGKAEDFFSDASGVTAQVVEFLGLPAHPIGTDKAHNQYSYQKFYQEPNQRLTELTGVSW
jgi:hypothetical protein